MATEMHRFGTSEVDDDEMGMDVKKEDDNDEDDEDKNMGTHVMAGADRGLASTSSNNQFQHHQQYQEQSSSGGGSWRCRPVEEKKRTKLRERQRRAITAKILAGLRRHGNYNLSVRADINDVNAALAREAGWVVLPDGTSFLSRSQGTKPAGGTSTPVVTSSASHVQLPQTPAASLRGVSSGCQIAIEDDACQINGLFVPSSTPYDISNVQSQPSDMMGAGVNTQDDPLIGIPMVVVGSRQVVGMQ